MTSAGSSSPIDRRIVVGVMPASASWSGVMWLCVIEAGCAMRLRASPMLATSRTTCRRAMSASTRAKSSSASPVECTSNEKTDAAPARQVRRGPAACQGLDSRPGWLHARDGGVLVEEAAPRRAPLALCRAMRRSRVSRPCSSWKALNADSEGPRSWTYLVFTSAMKGEPVAPKRSTRLPPGTRR